MKQVSIVTYHYVRDLTRTRFPEIKGCLIQSFVEQLDFLEQHYQFVTIEQCIEAAYGEGDIPENAVLLTFDDGYSDHYQNVFPLLDERGIQGCFFPPAKPILEGALLDVNKIHFTLAAGKMSSILEDVFTLLDEYRSIYKYPSNRELYQELAKEGRFDHKDVIFVKRVLQHALPFEARKQITSRLFERYVTNDEKAFAAELYMNVPQLQCMQRNGMFIGSHGYQHLSLGTLSAQDQREDIERSIEFLRYIGAPTEDWAMCYPYGSYNENLLEILKEKQCKIAFSTKIGVASLAPDNMLELKRLDTNDLPRGRHAEMNQWTLAIQ